MRAVIAIILILMLSGCKRVEDRVLAPSSISAVQEETREFIIAYTGSECINLNFRVYIDFTDRPVKTLTWSGLIPDFTDTITVATTAYQLDYALHLMHDPLGTIMQNIVPIPAEGTPTFMVDVLQPGCFGEEVTASASWKQSFIKEAN